MRRSPSQYKPQNNLAYRLMITPRPVRLETCRNGHSALRVPVGGLGPDSEEPAAAR